MMCMMSFNYLTHELHELKLSELKIKRILSGTASVKLSDCTNLTDVNLFSVTSISINSIFS